MVQFLQRMLLEFTCDIHILGPFQHLRVDHLRDDRLVLAGQVLIKQLDEIAARDNLLRH